MRTATSYKMPGNCCLFVVLFMLSACQTTTKPPQAAFQWQPVTLNFEGPQTSETASMNPFTDYRLLVRFVHQDSERVIRGYYAADGNAAETSASSGNVWQVKFTPDRPGLWRYNASLYKGAGVALADRPEAGQQIPITNATGNLKVVKAESQATGFHALGTLYTKGRYYYTADQDKVWLKGGTNSPENLLAFNEFDQTYRITTQQRDGEASSGTDIHEYKNHRKDWLPGDPTWQSEKGKNLIGVMNYLADRGMNSAYFLTLNIEGDGKDVWPYTSPTNFERFDVSKLAQWNVVFSHMQKKGIALHLVIQETENERLLDDGDTGPLRQLYFQELIARFAHHPGLIWNLGEENGPAEFSPDAQTDEQRIAMSRFLKEADPYSHPVIIHTHSTPESKDEIVTPLLGESSLDGLSFQVNLREQVYSEITKWLSKAESHNRKWAITMDEIGEWMDGAKTDTVDPTHDTLRRHALWGSLMAGGAGVEWYFGAHQQHNDLTAEDLRTRDNLWRQTKVALDFFNQYIPFEEMSPAPAVVSNDNVYSYIKSGNIYLLYIPEGESTELMPGSTGARYSLSWFDPLHGGELIRDTKVLSGKTLSIPAAPGNGDWVALIQRLK